MNIAVISDIHLGRGDLARRAVEREAHAVAGVALALRLARDALAAVVHLAVVAADHHVAVGRVAVARDGQHRRADAAALVALRVLLDAQRPRRHAVGRARRRGEHVAVLGAAAARDVSRR